MIGVAVAAEDRMTMEFYELLAMAQSGALTRLLPPAESPASDTAGQRDDAADDSQPTHDGPRFPTPEETS